MKALVVLCVVLILAVAPVVFGADNPTTAPQPLVSLEDLRPFLFTNKRQYALGEPVHLKLVLANWSENNIFEIQGNLHPANDLEIQVARAGDLSVRYTGGLKKDVLIPMMSATVRPRQITALRWTLCWEPDHASGFLFEQPGIYTLTCRARMTLNNVSRDLVFQPMEIEIASPNAEVKNARSLIFTPECAEELQRLQTRKETLKTWQEVAQRFPKTVWGPFARMLVADYELDSISRDFEPVLEQIEALIREYPDFALRDDLYYLMAMCQDRMGQPVEALRWLYRLQREYPSSPYIHPGVRLFRKYLCPDGWDARYAPWFLRE